MQVVEAVAERIASPPLDWTNETIESLVEAPVCYGVVQVGEDTQGGVPIVAIKYVKEIDHAPMHRTAKMLEEPYLRSRVKPGDVLISIKGTIGRVGVVPPGFNGNISRELARIRVKDGVCAEYIAYQLEADATQRRVFNSVVGTTRLEFSIAALRKFEIPVPPTLEEQVAIAGALSDVDALLGVLDRMLTKKRDLKQAAMQQLLTGQTRLPGFNSEWEEKTLGDIVNFLSGGTPSRSNDDYWTGEIPWISASSLRCFEVFRSDSNVTKDAVAAGSKMAPINASLLLVRGSSSSQRDSLRTCDAACVFQPRRKGTSSSLQRVSTILDMVDSRKQGRAIEIGVFCWEYGWSS